MADRTQPDAPVYVGLGDSISIDDYAGGPGRGGASLLARNRDEDFPHWRGADLATRLPGLAWRVLASDGATSRGVVEDQLPALQRSGLRPSVVTVTAGGNDVLSRFGNTPAALDAVRAVREHLHRALERLGALTAPDARVVVGTVYDPSDGTGDATRLGLPPWPGVVGVLGELNAALGAVAAEHGARVADVHGRFLGHGLARGDAAQREARPADRELWYCGVIEPNAWGASGVRAAFWNALALG
ncbi:GDSL-type esterase/lipase family protein [Quadrisphaera sp. DSM 44207]|uniref:SGNH/GDSL hydrolase family protein n=1 Tax=Quadrisphaera sp. DSM 44207 TaxID=1881057 RepID=UPI000881315D|nr:GDSL-type esterase/lipase family protein [Quadrisphaera sp. DSM 44207]SDQ78626.1 GDSL-like Lipase/Acylhydrolase family protein [Quadrisphaera sp. DSM 44207]